MLQTHIFNRLLCTINALHFICDCAVLDLQLRLHLDKLALELIDSLGESLHLTPLGHLLCATCLNLRTLLLHTLALLSAALDVLLGVCNVRLLLLKGPGSLLDLLAHKLPFIRLDEAREAFQLGSRFLVFEVRSLLGTKLLQLGVDLFAKKLSSTKRIPLTHIFNLFDLLILLCHSLHSLLLPLLKHTRTSRFLHHAEDFRRLHVEHFGDFALHDEEIRVVDIKLYALEEILDCLESRLVPVEEIL